MVLPKPRERKHRKRIKTEKGLRTDSNATEILPTEQDARQQKHEDLRQEFHQPGMSSKKKKRLDKYIENKLKKEENLGLLKKLSQRKVDTSLMQSSKNLGRQTVSKREALAQALKHQRAGIDTEEDRELLYQPIFVEDAGVASISAPKQKESKTQAPVAVGPPQVVDANPIGMGLKRPLQTDETGQPVIKKRQRLNKTRFVAVNQEQLSWSGFDSDEDSGSSDGNSDGEDDGESDSEDDSDSDDTDMDDEDEDAATYPLFNLPQIIAQPKVRLKPRVQSDFKTWATQQINEARDFTPSVPMATDEGSKVSQPKLDHLRPKEEDPLPRELQTNLDSTPRQIHSVEVKRSEAIQESRMKLPIVAEEQKIMEAIHNNAAVIVCGATGSGKTTQVPQFLYEAGYGDPKGPTPGLIGVTQPRRVAAVTMAKRVGEELGDKSKSAYQIRFDSTVEANTAIKFMTDGILIREISQDFALSKYSAIVIDEAHERSVNTDILIGMISRIVGLRDKLSKTDSTVKPLKLIIMSATLIMDSFLNNQKLFPSGIPPLVESEGRQYPVTMHFSRRTRQDYVEEAYQKIVKGHRKLPPGGMLIFLTGQNEINDLAKRLREALSTSAPSYTSARVRVTAKEAPIENDDLELQEDHAEVEDFSDQESGDEQEDKEFDLDEEETVSLKALILPLYSQLPTKEQLRVFEPPPDNTRLIILATNVAETSITIPGIRYVFDSGRTKEKKYNKTTGVQSFEIGWTSKASALQRAGRAGRTGPGHCYRLYSSAMYERDFTDHTEPEILRAPIEGVILQLKSMDLSNTINFPFPTAPNLQDVAAAEKLLSYLGALDKDGKITTLGRDLSLYPISPRFAKMLAIGHQFNSIYHVAAMVAALAVPELIILQARLHHNVAEDEEDGYQDSVKDVRSKSYNEAQAIFSAHDSTSDAVKLTAALCAYMWSKDPDAFCKKMFLHSKAMKEAARLYSQLLGIIAHNIPGSVDTSQTHLQPPKRTQIAAMKQIAAAGFLDQVAIRADLAPIPPEMPRKPTRSADVPYITLFPTHEGRGLDVLSQVVFVHPSSIMAHTTSAKSMPQYLIYSHVQRGNSAVIGGTKIPKIWMFPMTPVTGLQLASLARNTPLLEYGKPIGKVEAVDGRSDTRNAWCVPSLIGERGGRVWPLPAVKTLQRRDGKGGWFVEKVLK